MGGGGRRIKSKFSNVGAQFDVCFPLHTKTLNYPSSGSPLAHQKYTLLHFYEKKQRPFVRSSIPYFTTPTEP